MPPIHEQQRSIRLPNLLLKRERKCRIESICNIQLEGGDEEPYSRQSIGQTLRQVPSGPRGGVEAGEMPPFSFAVETAFVHESAVFVWVTIVDC